MRRRQGEWKIGSAETEHMLHLKDLDEGLLRRVSWIQQTVTDGRMLVQSLPAIWYAN